MVTNTANNLIFLKIRDGLWNSLQKHLDVIYEADESFNRSIPFTDAYPFDISLIDADKLEQYWNARSAFRNLYIDEVFQLETLVKAIKSKKYEEAGKKELYLMILGYVNVVESVFSALDNYSTKSLHNDTELANAKKMLCRTQKFMRLQIRGALPKLGF